MNFKFPGLPYSYDALEPYIDARTMELHYEKHHRTYYEKFLKGLENQNVGNKSLEQILGEISGYQAIVRNNGGGFYNHNIFWTLLSPKAGQQPSGTLAQGIQKKFGSIDAFKDQFTQAALNLFGSGFTWLVVKDGGLEIVSTPNQDNPLMDVVGTRGQPVLAVDVWEHAYYLKYQNRRPDYLKSWWNVINWEQALAYYETATK